MGSASARGDRWTFLEAADFTTPACGTDILETVVANKEYAKFAVDPMGPALRRRDGVLKVLLAGHRDGQVRARQRLRDRPRRAPLPQRRLPVYRDRPLV